MTKPGKYERVLQDMRSRFWHALPARAYRVRRLVAKMKNDRLETGEREELELLVKRLSGNSATFGFEEVALIGDRMAAILDEDRRGQRNADALMRACDELDAFIDDMTIEALALRLRAALI